MLNWTDGSASQDVRFRVTPVSAQGRLQPRGGSAAHRLRDRSEAGETGKEKRVGFAVSRGGNWI